ncbi:MAG: PilZ domain-containing protein [Nitrospira sp.]|nr:PilZ domain-containing protein [Nitrospira sp.]
MGELLKSFKKVSFRFLNSPLYRESVISVPKEVQTQTMERRQVPRVTLRRAITYETGVLPDGQLMLAGKRLSGSLINISNGGICITTRRRLSKDMVLKVNLPVSEISPAAPTLAQVMWVMSNTKRREYRTGLRFII